MEPFHFRSLCLSSSRSVLASVSQEVILTLFKCQTDCMCLECLVFRVPSDWHPFTINVR